MFLTLASPYGSDRIRPFFTVRQGGVGQPPWDSLNIGHHVNDDPNHVVTNRERLMNALNLPIERLRLANQIHGTDVLVADQTAWPDPPDADALVTVTPGVVVAVMVADCAPLLLADPIKGVVAAAHAGWRGSVFGVLDNTLKKMVELGAQLHNIRAWLGPCIHPQHYDVGPDFIQALKRAPDAEFHLKHVQKSGSSGGWRFDLPGHVVHTLVKLGIPESRIDDTQQCTYENHDRFFSYRFSHHQGDPTCGRQLGGILLL